MAEREPKRKSYYVCMYVKCQYESVNVRRLGTAGSGTFRFYDRPEIPDFENRIFLAMQLQSINRNPPFPPSGYCTSKYSAHVSPSFSLVISELGDITNRRRYIITNVPRRFRDSKLSHVHAPQISFSNKINSFANNQYLL